MGEHDEQLLHTPIAQVLSSLAVMPPTYKTVFIEGTRIKQVLLGTGAAVSIATSDMINELMTNWSAEHRSASICTSAISSIIAVGNTQYTVAGIIALNVHVPNGCV